MRKSKLFELLESFTQDEWLRFNDFVQSPYFNKKPELVRLSDYFFSQYPDFPAKLLKKECVYQAVFPDQPFDEKQLAYQMSYLLQLAEKFLSMEHFLQDELQEQLAALQAYLSKGLEKHYNFLLAKTQRQLHSGVMRSQAYWKNRFSLAEIEVEAFTNKRLRRYDESFQILTDTLDSYYFYEKLRYRCAMSNLEAIVSEKYEVAFIQEIEGYLEQQPDLDPQISIYSSIYRCLTGQETEDHFFTLQQLIIDNEHRLDQKELREILLSAINICARRIRQGKSEYYAYALDFYLTGINRKALFDGKYLTHWTYNNVVKLALRLQKFDWLEHFIDTNYSYLHPDRREDTRHYSMAELFYHNKAYHKVLDHLNQLQFSDLEYYLGSRIILLKTFYALDEFDSMTSLLASFSMLLRRNKKISTDYKKTLLNFCRLLHLILRSRPDKREKVVEEIKNTKKKIEGPWLVEVAEEMLR